MKLFAITLAISFLALIGYSCKGEVISGNGTIVTKEISISDYNKIKLGGKIQLEYEYKPGQPPYLRIEIDENIFPLLKVNTNSETLSFDSDYNLSPTQFKIYTNSSSLTKLDCSGSGDILLKGNVAGKLLKIDLKGSSNIIAEDLKYDNLEIEIAGTAELQLKGLVDHSKYNIKGSGTIKAFELTSQTVKCDISGKGNIETFASKELDIKIKGSGEVIYAGNPPVINQQVFGNGKVLNK